MDSNSKPSAQARVRRVPVRGADQTLFTLQLPKDMRNDSKGVAKKQVRPEAQLWRMAFSFAQKVGFENIPVVP